MQTVGLSQRLQTIADMVTPGRVVADVGCDHGFVSIYLVQSGIADKVYAMDVRKGPLEGAISHIKEAGLSERIETRLSDGIEKLQAGEADALIIAGMGGKLMQSILERYPEKIKQMKELILQPQSELYQFRKFLRETGLKIVEEKIVLEDGKYYFPMKVVWEDTLRKTTDEQELEDTYGPILLQEKSPLFLEYLQWETHTYQGVKEELQKSGNERSKKRLLEIERKLKQIEKAISY